MQTIHQLVAGFRFGDAISNAAIQMRKVFRGWGCRSDILSRWSSIASELRDDGRDLAEAASELGPDDIAVLHLSIGNPVNLAFREGRCGFLQMSDIIAETMLKAPFIPKPTYEDYVQTDCEARRLAEQMIK